MSPSAATRPRSSTAEALDHGRRSGWLDGAAVSDRRRAHDGVMASVVDEQRAFGYSCRIR